MPQLNPKSDVQVQDGGQEAGAEEVLADPVSGPSTGRALLAPVRIARGSSRSARMDALRFRTCDEHIEGVDEDAVCLS